ncbi:hypothetical protein H0H93_008486 [Arthromyces matolae]|nr:hypothetical protein H0H93_008486 [Arthromyces matolae]
MQPNNSPKPLYATVVASPASKRSASPAKETYKPIIRIPALGRIIQGKKTDSNSAQTKETPKETQEVVSTSTTAPTAERPSLLVRTSDNTNPMTVPQGVSSNDQPVTTEKPDRKHLKKAKKVRQAMARAAARLAATAETKTLNEVVEKPNCSAPKHDDLSPMSETLFDQNASPAPSAGSSAHSTPRFTAAEKGKGKANSLSLRLRAGRTPSHTSEEPPSNTNPNKRKAFESPSDPKILKRSTAMANPPLQTPTRLSDLREPGLTEHITVQTTSQLPVTTPHVQTNTNPHEITADNAWNMSPPGNEKDTDHPHPFTSNSYDIFAKLPSAADIERAIETHIRLKPAFSGTETDLHPMKYPGDNASQGYPKPYRSPPPLPESYYARSTRTNVESPPTPTPNTRRGTSSNIPLRTQARTHTSIRSDSPHYPPPASPLSEDEDRVSMIDSDDWPGRDISLPPTDTFGEEQGPPPYAHSRNETHPHTPTHNENQQSSGNERPPSPSGVTNITYDESDDMLVDNDPKGTWTPGDTPGTVVNGVGLKLVARPQDGWYRPEYSSGPMQDLTKKSLAVVEEKEQHSIWGLLYKANYSLLTEQRIADAIRNNVGDLITIEDGQRIGVTFPEVDSDAPQESRLAKPWHVLLLNLSRTNQYILLNQYAFITKELVCWFSPIQEHKTHFAGMIVGFQHKKEDHDKVLATIKNELAQNKHGELARFVNTKSNPPDADAYHTIIENLRIEFTTFKYRTENDIRAWCVILPLNNLNVLDTFGFITMLATVKFHTDGAGTGFFIKSHEYPLCDGCKGLGHTFSSCPYHDLPGWPLPKPAKTSTDTPQDQPRSWVDIQNRDKITFKNRGRGASNSNQRAGGPGRGRGNSNGRGRARGGNLRRNNDNYYA